MQIYQAIILGIVQGLTELLPISSSAHLFLIPWFLKWEIPEAFDVALHFGTLLAIGIFFFKDWIKLISGGYKSIIKKEKSAEGRMFWYIVLATIPGGIIGFILYFIWKDTNPYSAKQAANIAWISIAISFVIGFISGLTM